MTEKAGGTFVALFSGINVGGNRIVKMAELRAFFEDLGFGDVASYVQSGNVVFYAAKGDAASLQRDLEAAFERRWGFASRIMVCDGARLERINVLGPLDAPLNARVRSMAKPVPARLSGDRLVFEAPEYGVAPGQAAVLYDGDRVLGGGWIAGTEAAALAA